MYWGRYDSSTTLLSFISAIASYVLQDDVEFKDGETIWLSEADIHQITLSKGVALPDQDILKISYWKKKAIPYAQRWAELDPEDKVALEVIKEGQGLYNKCWGYSYKSSRQHFLLQ